MNIPAINSLGLILPFKQKETKIQQQRFGLTMAKPLLKDTVSFKGTPKLMGDRKNAISMSLAKDIHEEAVMALNYMKTRLKPFLYDLEVSAFAPKNPIELICERAKSATSIVEKAVTRGWENKEEIKKGMTDLAGMKIIMRDASRPEVNKVIERLIDFTKETGVKIVEIENKRPIPIYNQYDEVIKSYDYASPGVIARLQKAASKVAGRDIRCIDENTPSNYMAIHMLMELPNGITGELQIMGHDIAQLKELEDMCYKVKNGKNLDKRYAVIEKTLSPIKPPAAKDGVEDEAYIAQVKKYQFLKDEHDKYTQEAYMEQREKDPRPFNSKKKETFLRIPSYLPKELDFNNIYQLKKECDLMKAPKKTKKSK